MNLKKPVSTFLHAAHRISDVDCRIGSVNGSIVFVGSRISDAFRCRVSGVEADVEWFLQDSVSFQEFSLANVFAEKLAKQLSVDQKNLHSDARIGTGHLSV